MSLIKRLLLMHWSRSTGNATDSTARIERPGEAPDESDGSLFRPAGLLPGLAPEGALSNLNEATETYVGQVIEFRTFYGYGWIGVTRYDEVPAPFRARLMRLLPYRTNTRRGGIARIEEPGHALDTMWVMFATRHLGVFDLRDRIPHCNVAIFDRPPADPPARHAYWMIHSDLPGLTLAGFAEVAALAIKQ